MCGIVGFIGNGGDEGLLKRMTERIHHRGPDDDGFLIQTRTNAASNANQRDDPTSFPPLAKGRMQGGVYLGMRRLAIIDVSGGKQPIFNEDGMIGVVYNGEIYNYKELRLELEKAGHIFKTHSDTESIVHGYEEWGTGVFSHLNGMFAVALWDARNNRLVLGRDRVGEKPLMFAEWNGTFYFGSELKVFMEIPGFPKDIQKESFIKFIDQGYVWGVDTILQNVKRLGAGGWLVYEKGKMEIGKYWSIDGSLMTRDETIFSRNTTSDALGRNFTTQKLLDPSSSRFATLDDSIQTLETLLSDAVKIRLMSEVPLGVFLSGGLDSSLIAYYAQKHSSQNVKTFSIKFSDESFDESKYARKVAEFLGTEHTELEVGEQELLSMIDDLPSVMDEPLADSSIIPTYWLSKLTREHVTVALGGDAGDELFWGYQTFHAWKYWNALRRVPGFLRSFGAALVSRLPSGSDYFSLDFKLKRGLLNFDQDPVVQHFRWFSPFTIKELERLCHREGAQATVAISLSRAYHRDCFVEPRNDSMGVLEQSAYLYQKYYLTDDIFTKVDRASMANSLETRAPFVDYRLIEFANQLPNEYKLRDGEGKYILKKLAERVLPNEITNRYSNRGGSFLNDLFSPRKHGFPSPVDRWMRGPLKEKVSRCFSEKVIREQGLLNHEYMQFLWKDFLNGNHYRARQIWTLFVWQMWLKQLN